MLPGSLFYTPITIRHHLASAHRSASAFYSRAITWWILR